MCKCRGQEGQAQVLFVGSVCSCSSIGEVGRRASQLVHGGTLWPQAGVDAIVLDRPLVDCHVPKNGLLVLGGYLTVALLLLQEKMPTKEKRPVGRPRKNPKQ